MRKNCYLSCFNPYSTGFSSFIYDYIEEVFSEMQVSILILLDSLLLSCGDFGTRIYIECFNPYSTGFSSFISISSYSFLVYCRFQSLFYWILFFYKVTAYDQLRYLKSFNPYSTGFSSFIGLRQNLEFKGALVSILILLDSLLLFSGSRFAKGSS